MLKCNLITSLIILVSAWIILPEAHAQDLVASCAMELKPDLEVLHQDYMAAYQYLSMINESNYEQAKNGGGINAIIEDIPVGASYSQFDEKRREFLNQFKVSQTTRQKTDLYLSTFSSSAYQAYAECLRSQSNAPIEAWISLKTSNQVYVQVKSVLPEGTSASLQVDGDAPLRDPHPIAGSSQQTLVFKRTAGEDFANAFDVINAQGQPIGTANVYLPVPIIVVPVTTIKTLTVSGHCGAGCQGSTTGCQNVENVSFSIDNPSGTLVSGTQSLTTTSDTGIAHLYPQWNISPTQATTNFVCEADNGNTQKFISVTGTIQEKITNFVEQTRP